MENNQKPSEEMVNILLTNGEFTPVPKSSLPEGTVLDNYGRVGHMKGDIFVRGQENQVYGDSKIIFSNTQEKDNL